MISATGLVLMMTLPGLALFYAGMVRKKNVLATMAQSLAAVLICSIMWSRSAIRSPSPVRVPISARPSACFWPAWPWTG
jgi:hypothetical protein